MAYLNRTTKQLQLKIVYYGPALSGKTTNLVRVHESVKAKTDKEKSDLVTLATSTDRTLFFDFLPLQTVKVNGYEARFQLYTVPGQVIYNTTRQLVLRGVDGVVFVADSAYDRLNANIESLKNLYQNLEEIRIDPKNVPVVIQYNKRDVKNAAPIDYLEYLLNKEKRPYFEACAGAGKGVFPTLNAISKILLKKFLNQGQSSRPANSASSGTVNSSSRPAASKPGQSTSST